MSAIDLVAQGIKTGNWRLVCDGYRELSGKTLSPPEAKMPDLDLKNLLKAALELVEPTPRPTIDAPDKKRRGRKPGRKKRGRPRSVPEPEPVESPDENDDIQTAEETEPESDADPQPPTRPRPTGQPVKKGAPIPILKGKPRMSKRGEPVINPQDIIESECAKPNAFGIKTKLVSTGIYESERDENQKNRIRKTKRPKPKMFDGICSTCEKPFKSKVETLGGKCPQCLKSLRRGS